ncbi:hypothetical protein IM40_04000 [Candidatus Paracaedimonas acanthamoebae]|nr:hypothetical protein IM40_04000 [Candidatus Paracaedimonas acanthamoebae]
MLGSLKTRAWIIWLSLSIISLINYPTCASNSFETIRISEFDSNKLKRQNVKDCTISDPTSGYNSCYGNGMIFTVFPPPKEDDGRYKDATMVQEFYKKLTDSGVKQNVVVARAVFKFNHLENLGSFTLPYIFFSGSPDEVKSTIPLNKKEVETTIIALPTCLKTKLKEQIEGSSLESIARECLKDFFLPAYKNPIFIFDSNASSIDQLKDSILNFRGFIYSHFIDEESEGYKLFMQNNPHTTFISILRGIASYSKGCSGDKMQKQSEPALNLALQEIYLRQPATEKLLKEIFDEDSLDELFGQGSHGEGNKKKGMSFCFHQSEQALLGYLLKKDGNKKHHNEFISILIEFLKYNLNSHFDQYKEVLSVTSSSAQSGAPTIADDLPSLSEIVQSPVEQQGSNVILVAKCDIDTNLELFSPRHICKYCRGTFYICQQKILNLIKDVLQNNGLNILEAEQKNKKVSQEDNLYDKVVTHFKLPIKPKSIIVKYMGRINLSIFATSHQPAEPALMGKMETIHE